MQCTGIAGQVESEFNVYDRRLVLMAVTRLKIIEFS